MDNERNEKSKKLLAVLAVAILVAVIGHVVSVVSYNRQEHTVKGADENELSYMALDNREDSTSSWLKRDFDLYGDTVDLSAQTFDGVFFNNAEYPVSDWSMTVRILGDCFINNAWCGTVEIHQNAGTDGEKVQTVDLRSYDINDIELDHMYDGDLLIPLKKGDYIVYYPSSKDNELPVAAGSDLAIGMIFYYLDSIDLGDYEITYHYHKSYTEGAGFYIITGLAALWIAILFALIIAAISYKRAWKDAELRKTGISYVSVIYDYIYIVDLIAGELVSVYDSKDDPSKKLPNNIDPIEKLKKMFAADVDDRYGAVVSEFMDSSTLEERFDRDSIACEYVSKTKGWCLIRLFAIDRAPGEPLRKFIFTIQNINEEKTEMDRIEDSISGEATDINRQRLFIEVVEKDLTEPVNDIINKSTMIMEISENETVRDHAAEIQARSSSLKQMLDKFIYTSKLSSGLLEAAAEEYDAENMLRGIIRDARAVAEAKGLEFAVDISPSIPRRMTGDEEKLKMAANYLIADAVRYTDSGSVKLSVFGKANGDSEHILVSVRDTGRGMTSEADDTGIGHKMIRELLKLMGSELHVISESGEGSELYFEIEQPIADETPIGKFDIEGVK